jgi:hypothetical protein
MSKNLDGKRFSVYNPVSGKAVCLQNVHINVQNVLLFKICENVIYALKYIKLCNERKRLRF